MQRYDLQILSWTGNVSFKVIKPEYCESLEPAVDPVGLPEAGTGGGMTLWNLNWRLDRVDRLLARIS